MAALTSVPGPMTEVPHPAATSLCASSVSTAYGHRSISDFMNRVTTLAFPHSEWGEMRASIAVTNSITATSGVVCLNAA